MESEHTRSTQDERYALIQASQGGHCDVVRQLLKGEAEVNTFTQNGRTPLMAASQSGHCDVVRLLLERDAEVNTVTQGGSNALMFASQKGHCDIVKILLDREAKVDAVEEDGLTALTLASQNGHCDVVKLLLEKGAEVNTESQNGSTALIVASEGGYCGVVKLLLGRGAKVNTVTQAGVTALMLAVQEGHSEVLKLLLEMEAEVNTVVHDSWTPLIVASQEGHYDVAKMLLEKGAKVNTVVKDGSTALILASQEGHYDVAKMLLEMGAKVNTVTQDGSTALTMASENGHCDVVRLLLDSEAEVNTVEGDGYTALALASQEGHLDVVKLLLEREAEVNIVEEDGWTALTLASQEGHWAVVKLLLERGVAVNRVTHNGSTALTVSSQNGHCAVVRLLLERGAEVNTVKGDGSSALILASEEGHCDVVKLLLERVAEVNTVTQNGTTALMKACLNDHCDVVKLLLEREADVNVATQAGHTALMFASQEGHCDIVRLLLRREAENTVTQAGTTALMLASLNGHCDVAKLLVESGAEVNTVTEAGSTALMFASQKGHSDVVKLLVENKAEVNTMSQKGNTPLMLASKDGHCDVVKLLLEREAEVNIFGEDSWTALTVASQESHCDVVKLLLERDADVNIVTSAGNTALMHAVESGHWNIAKLLIDAGANVSYVNKDGETPAMYIVFANATRKFDTQLDEIVKHIWQTSLSQRSHYGMSCASFALVGAFLYNTQSEWFDCHFAKWAVGEVLMYGYLPNIFHGYVKWDNYLFSPYQGVEGKISIHTMATAVVCKLPHTALQWLTAHHRDKLENMLGQTPLHLLAMENTILGNMKEKLLLLIEKVGFSFSDRDNNGRVPYHIACLCLNAQFLLCGLRSDSKFRANMLIRDHLDKTPLLYMINLLYKTTKHSDCQALTFLSAQQTLKMLIQIMGSDFAVNTQQNACNIHRLSNTTIDSLKSYFDPNMTVAELTEKTNEAGKMLFGTGDVASLFTCSSRGVIRLPDKQHIVVRVMHLLRLIGTEMGKIDPLFECIPELKGSVQEYTKCGELDELDTSMMLVKFADYFSVQHFEDNITTGANIAPLCNRYWISGKTDMFSSVEFCADFWQIFLKALDTEVTRTYIKSDSLILENCKRRHGFVGMLNISCAVGGNIQLISVDIAPCIVSDNLNEYTALLRPRHYDNEEVGREFYQDLELSTSEKDWNFLKFLPPEVMCAYVLVKMLRSVAKTFQTEKGRVYKAEDILSSYMVKTALLWILDPEERRPKIYRDLEINLVFDYEHSSSYKEDVAELCQDMLQESQAPGMDSSDVELLLNIHKKCTTGTEKLPVRERIMPYVVATRRSDRQQQSGINLQQMQTNWKPDISHQDEVIDSRMIGTEPENKRARMDQKNDGRYDGQFSHHKIAYPDISEETAKKCRVWAQRIVRILPHLLQYDRWTADRKEQITGVRNYYLPYQEIHARDKDLTIALCQILEAILE